LRKETSTIAHTKKSEACIKHTAKGSRNMGKKERSKLTEKRCHRRMANEIFTSHTLPTGGE